MTMRPETFICAMCSLEYDVLKMGPVPTYCSGACRQAAFRKRSGSGSGLNRMFGAVLDELDRAMEEIDRLRASETFMYIRHEHEKDQDLFGPTIRSTGQLKRIWIYVDGPHGKHVYACPGDPDINPNAQITVEVRDWTNEEAGLTR